MKNVEQAIFSSKAFLIMKVFIGWSGSMGELIGQATIDYLKTLRGWVKPFPWTMFQKGVTVWEQLLEQLSSVDSAILIATPDDLASQRGHICTLPRDNIILEYGLFTGALSRERVLLLVIGDPDLPSDMLGVNQTRLNLPASSDILDIHLRNSLQEELRRFVEQIRCSQRAEVELRRAICSMTKAQALLPEIFWALCSLRNYPKYSDDQFSEAVQACTIRKLMPVGAETDPPIVHIYVDFSRADGVNQECLATRLVDAVIEWFDEERLRPSKIALLGKPNLPEQPNVELQSPKDRTNSRGLPLLAQASSHLGYPVLFVDTEDSEVFGRVDIDDHVVIIHDVLLSGQKPVRAAYGLRSRGATVNHLFSLVVNPAYPLESLTKFLEENDLHLRFKSAPNAEAFK
jgi:hypothetical protein